MTIVLHPPLYLSTKFQPWTSHIQGVQDYGFYGSIGQSFARYTQMCPGQLHWGAASGMGYAVLSTHIVVPMQTVQSHARDTYVNTYVGYNYRAPEYLGHQAAGKITTCRVQNICTEVRSVLCTEKRIKKIPKISTTRRYNNFCCSTTHLKVASYDMYLWQIWYCRVLLQQVITSDPEGELGLRA